MYCQLDVWKIASARGLQTRRGTENRQVSTRSVDLLDELEELVVVSNLNGYNQSHRASNDVQKQEKRERFFQ